MYICIQVPTINTLNLIAIWYILQHLIAKRKCKGTLLYDMTLNWLIKKRCKKDLYWYSQTIYIDTHNQFIDKNLHNTYNII